MGLSICPIWVFYMTMFFCQNLNSHICSSQSRLSLRLMTLIFWQTYYEFSIMMVSMPFEFKSQDAPHICPECLWSVQKACRASYEIRRMEFLKFVETSESLDKLLAVQFLSKNSSPYFISRLRSSTESFMIEIFFSFADYSTNLHSPCTKSFDLG